MALEAAGELDLRAAQIAADGQEFVLGFYPQLRDLLDDLALGPQIEDGVAQGLRAPGLWTLVLDGVRCQTVTVALTYCEVCQCHRFIPPTQVRGRRNSTRPRSRRIPLLHGLPKYLGRCNGSSGFLRGRVHQMGTARQT